MNCFTKWMMIFLMLLSTNLKAAPDSQLSNINAKAFNKYNFILKNSTWVVPPQTLPATEYVAGTETLVSDQTVWVINTFNQGYFFGDSYTAINGKTSSHKKLVGSVTPLGNVYITFYPTAGSLLSTDVVAGVGQIQRLKGKYVFLMQMNSAQNNINGLSHWSYMVNVNPSDALYQSLPSVNMSVPQFISSF